VECRARRSARDMRCEASVEWLVLMEGKSEDP
jgi:hypothetical protein